MPKIKINGLDHYYEQEGKGPSLVFIHGAFGDSNMWDPQWQYFASKYRLLRYDLRGHGRTGSSSLERYTIDTFSDDLASLLDSLDIQAPIICGQSLGGSIAQAFAVRHPGRLKGLILSSSMIAIDFTLMDKLLCHVFFPGWAMSAVIRVLSVRDFTRFSLWLGRLTLGRHLLGPGRDLNDYLEGCMLQIDRSEYIKIWEALYGFKLFPLERIACPTLVLNGEHEPKNMFLHTKEILRRIPQSQVGIIPGSHHVSNLENPPEFNQYVDKFLRSIQL